MKILIFGAGAIGSVIGGFLAKAGHNVSFLGRPWHMEKISRDGLAISGIWGEQLIKGIEVFNSISEIDGEFDLIVLTVKSYNTEEAAEKISSIFVNNPLVVHLQNGLGNREILLEYIPEDRLITGIVIFGVEIAPGEVKVTVSADDTVLGATGSAGVEESEVKKIVDIFIGSKIPARITDNIDSYIWSKVLYNCALNPLATLLECPYGLLAEISHTRDIMNQVIEEIYKVGKKIGVEFEPGTSDEYRKLFYSKLIPLTKEHHASMLQDIRMGKPTEIDALCGAISRYGEEYGVETPVNRLLTSLIKAIESKVH